MRRFAIYALVLLLALASTARAGGITLVLSEPGGPYAEFAATFIGALDSERWKITTLKSKQTGDVLSNRPDLIVSAGAEALRSALANGGATPIIATLLPRQNYERILADAGRGRARITAIYLDQPPARQALFLRHLLPEQKRIGILFSSETRSLAGPYRQALKNAGLTLDSEESDAFNTLLPGVNTLLPRVNVLLAIPDSTIYKRDNIKAILVTSYRHQRPIVAFSAPFVTAGALAALYSTPAQIARQTADLVTSSGFTLPPPMPPSQFAVAINQNVADALGLSVPDESTIRRAMLAEGEPTMNQLTLRRRLLALTLLPSILIAIGLVSYFTLSGIRALEGELRAKGMSTVRYLAPISEYGIIAGQIESLHGLAQAAVQESGVKAAIITNHKGRTIAVSGRVSLSSEVLGKALSAPALVAETDTWLAYGAPVRRSLNEVDTLFEPAAGTEKPLTPDIIGNVFIEFDKGELANRQRELMLRGLLIVFLGLILLALFAIAIADNLAKPLMRLVHAVREMSSGRLDSRVPQLSSGEIGILEQGFNDMASHIQDAHQSLQTRIEEATAELAFQARHDALTGLLNRREFELRLEKVLTNVQAGSDESSVLFIDLDRFKPVNDACGHLAGDELLRQISQLFRGRLREEDVLARLGGDEFGIILANCSGQRARQVAEDICALTAAYRFIWQDKVFSIGCSIGLTPVSRRVRNITEILAAGDTACYEAKDSGRNQVCTRDSLNTQERRQETSSWANRIASGLADDRLQIEAIPLCALQSNTLNGNLVELSARLLEPGQTPIALSALMDAAERYDLAPAIDLRFLEVAIGALARAQRWNKALICLVPLSGASLGRREVFDYIARTLASHKLPGTGLWLILSEDVSINQNSRAMEFSQQVRALGCHVCLDNFGGGVSSFSQLRSLAPSCVKLSHSLTRDLSGNRASTALLRAVQEITADQNIYTIVDDINNSAAVKQLQTLGISYVQGKAIAPREPFEVWLEGAVMRESGSLEVQPKA